MAANKRKILEAARKHAQKGAKEKALKEFGKLLKLDPRDSKVRLEMGDTYRRWGQVAEAIEAYSVVADQFMQEGFDARAVAVFKQIQNLQPNTFAHYEPLAELYQRMGLTAEAIGCLESAAEAFREAGQKQEALGLLRKMAAIDPSNTTSRIKVADLLQQEGMKHDAIAEYDAVVAELELQGDTEGAAKLFERILEIEPDRVPTIILYARNLIDRGSAQQAEPLAKRALELDRSPEQYELLADVYRAQNREEDLISLYRELAELYRERGDEERTREILQRYVPLEELGSTNPSSGYIDEGEDLGGNEDLLDDLSVGDETTLLDGDLLSDPSLLVSDDDSDLGALSHDDLNDFSSESLDLISDSNEMTSLLPDEPVDGVALGDTGGAEEEIDAGQLLAEASVYLRYGKRSQAIANLESILQREPDHRLALEKLGEALTEGDDSAKAVEMWSRAAKLAAESGEGDAAEVLRSRIATLDPAAAEALDLSTASVAAPEPDADSGPIADDLAGESVGDLDGDLSMPGGFDDAAMGGGPDDIEGADLPELDLAEVSVADLEIEIDVDDASFTLQNGDEDLLAKVDLEPPAGSQVERSADGGDEPLGPARADEAFAESDSIADGDLEEISIGGSTDDEADAAVGADETTGSEALTVSGSDDGDASPEKIAEDLEEADFYMEQGLHEEAEAVYARILSIVPNHPHAMVRLGELASQRGEAPGSVAGVAESAAQPDDSAEGVSEAPADSDIGADLADWKGDLPDEEDTATGVERVELDGASLDDEGSREISLEDVKSVAIEDEPDAPEAAGVAAQATLAESDLAADLGLDDSTEGSLRSEIDAVDTPSEDERDATGELPDTALEADAAASRAPRKTTEHPLDVAAETLPGEHAGADRGGAAAEIADESGEDGGDPGFDLAAELSQSFDRDSASSSGGLGPAESGDTSEDGFAAVFAEFKKGVSETLNEGDHQAHYDLGIAYREMGLLNDAVTEFRLAMSSPERRVGCLHLMGLCAHEMGEAEQAIGHYLEALSCEEISGEPLLAVKLDLGRSHESIGDVASASAVYEEIREIDPTFGDVEARLDELAKLEEAESQDDGSADTEEYETFAEFLGELDDSGAGEPEAEEPAGEAQGAPVWESFDDVVAELEDADDAALPPAQTSDAGPTDSAAPEDLEPAEPPADPEVTPKRRKKKISFV